MNLERRAIALDPAVQGWYDEARVARDGRVGERTEASSGSKTTSARRIEVNP